MKVTLLLLPACLTTFALLAIFPAPAIGAEGARTPGGWDQAQGKRVLYFSKSSGYEHSVVKRPTPSQLSHSEAILSALGKQHGFAVTCTKDGTVFTPENLAGYDVIVFFTSGDLLTPGTDQTPAMTLAGKAALLEAVNQGKGFVALHAANDSFHYRPAAPGREEMFVAHGDKVDPYIAMLN